MTAPLYGLVLAGGASRRMGRDKAALSYAGRPQLARAFDLLAACLPRCFVSVRPDQLTDPLRAAYPRIPDRADVKGALGGGPAVGLLSAHAAYPDAAWLVVACDLPMLDALTLSALIDARDAARGATAYLSEHDGDPEPLCTIWEPAMLRALRQQAATGKVRMRGMLRTHGGRFVRLDRAGALDNVNLPAEQVAAMQRLSAIPASQAGTRPARTQGGTSCPAHGPGVEIA
ncbi:NTP transferase domain-containing protein [Novacetimonas pomaceti]|uniref:Molybdenum cofactor guanylyltransferase n=1 Tax=Novacetimonas pomaceti TaxID=2021998 RepID=A0A318Q5R4_9PROT|nr:NTP transferase domain-containing protein [Novacetimonas pomaceti]PYD74877.1 molybdenum cofactor guanylyltransferase [Novacetimonas pomaceti]